MNILCRYKRVFFLRAEYNVMVKQWGINWYHKISDAIREVSHKPMSMKPGSIVRTEAKESK
jgi:hypothetical protein